jgi:hypothetical protein
MIIGEDDQWMPLKRDTLYGEIGELERKKVGLRGFD